MMRRAVRSPMVWLLLAGVVVGLLVGNDYGASYDEQDNADVGAAALKSYAGSDEYFSMPALADHGPFYFMVFSVGSILPASLIPGWGFPDGRHLTNYLTFLAGVACFYILCRRWLPRGSARLATLLFATQPLLFGHAFVNQKDIPFMAFFLATVTAGIVAADRWAALSLVRSGPSSEVVGRMGDNTTAHLASDWRSLSGGARFWLTSAALGTVVLSADLLFGNALYRYGKANLIAAYAGRAFPAIQYIFDLAAAEARTTQLAAYLDKYELFFAAFRFTLPPVMVGGCLCLFAWALPSLRTRLRAAWSDGWILPLALGGVLLGCTISIRQVGAFAGGLVCLYWLFRTRREALLPLALYLVLAGLTMYATWPYLWRDPVRALLASFALAGDFPAHKVLFRGELISSRSLPWEYFPRLAGLELTEPAIVLFLVGGWLCVKRWAMTPQYRPGLALLGLWIFVPLANLMFFGMSVYGNIRHLLFLLPALFVVAAFGLHAALQLLRRRFYPYLLAALVLLPGIVGIVKLHPYEYIYFNSLAGGVDGAYQQYDLDRWCTSYKEATEALNRIAERGASVLVYWPVQNAMPYMRKDLKVVTTTSRLGEAEFVLVCTRQLGEDVQPDGYHRVFAVRRGEAVLAEVWRQP